MASAEMETKPWKTTFSHDAKILFAIDVIFPILSTIMVAARLYARHIKRKQLGATDYLIIAAWVSAWGIIIPAYILLQQRSFGWPASELNPVQLQNFIIVLIAAIPFWALSTSMTKLSVLFFYLDIFENRRFKLAVWIVIAITIGYCLANFIEPFVTCRPMARQWNPTLDGVCGDEKAIYVSTACMNVIVDTIIVLLPATQIWRLQMPTLKKIGVSLVFAGGLVIVVFTALRIAYIVLIPLEDFSRWAVPDALYAQLEVNVSISVACLPIVQPTFVIVGNKISAISLRTLRRTNTSRASSHPDSNQDVVLPSVAPPKSQHDRYFRHMEARFGNPLKSVTSQVVAEHIPKESEDRSYPTSQIGTQDGVEVRKGVSVTHEPRSLV